MFLLIPCGGFVLICWALWMAWSNRRSARIRRYVKEYDIQQEARQQIAARNPVPASWYLEYERSEHENKQADVRQRRLDSYNGVEPRKWTD